MPANDRSSTKEKLLPLVVPRGLQETTEGRTSSLDAMEDLFGLKSMVYQSPLCQICVKGIRKTCPLVSGRKHPGKLQMRGGIIIGCTIQKSGLNISSRAE